MKNVLFMQFTSYWRQLRWIVEDVRGKPYGSAVGSLTSLNRDVWAKVSVRFNLSRRIKLKIDKTLSLVLLWKFYFLQERDHMLLIHPNNSRIFTTIEESLLTLVLDDSSPKHVDEVWFFQLYWLNRDKILRMTKISRMSALLKF